MPAAWVLSLLVPWHWTAKGRCLPQLLCAGAGQGCGEDTHIWLLAGTQVRVLAVHPRVMLQVHLGCGAGPLRQQPGQGGVETPVSTAAGTVLGLWLCSPSPLPCRCPALTLPVVPAVPESCLPPAPAPLLFPGRCPAEPAPLLPAEDLLLPCLRPPARHGQPRRWHPHAGQEEERPPGLPEPAVPPAARLRQPRCGHPHNGQARAAPRHRLPRRAGLPCGHGRPADSGAARC